MDDAKRELVAEWLEKAQHDLRAAEALSQLAAPILDVALYHCQQAAEKALKGLLVAQDIRCGKTHELELIVSLALPGTFDSAPEIVAAAAGLTEYASKHRYPFGLAEPTAAEFNQAFSHARDVCRFVARLLPEIRVVF